MLQPLRPDVLANPVDIQETTLTKDVLGRFVCSTIDEVLAAGGRPFDVVVIGAGLVGAYVAEKLYRQGEEQGLRILVLDAGHYLFATHVQNLPHVGLNAPDTALVTQNGQDPGPRNGVWGIPWHSNEPFTGIAYCPGGRSLFWGGWAPRLRSNDLASWPSDVRHHLTSTYEEVEKEIGVFEKIDYLSGALNDRLKASLDTAARSPLGNQSTIESVEDAPLAVQASQPGSGLFSFDKYSSATILIDAVRDDVARRWTLNDDSRRRLFVVPRAHVIRLGRTGDRVDRIELSSNGRIVSLGAGTLSANCQVVIANGTIESTRLALESFPVERGSFRMGANFMAHLRTNLTVRVKRSALGLAPSSLLEQGGAIVRGEIANADGTTRRYHLQVLASAEKGRNPEATMWTMAPDIDLYRNLLANQDPDWVTIVFRGLGEITGDPQSGPGSVTSFIDLTRGDDPAQLDEFQARRAWVQFTPTQADFAAWRELARIAVKLASSLGAAGEVEYLLGANWSATPPADPWSATRDALGNTHHEAGTLWMGDDSARSITDTTGKFHHVANVYAAGPALFPTAGSANPSLTALTMARRTAATITQVLRPAGIARLLYDGRNLADWQMAGFGGFLPVFDILESTGGPGLLWYTREAFGDFRLDLEWQVADRTANSGVFIRIPELDAANPQTDVDRAIQRGYEIQIDPRAFDSATNTEGVPLKATGAIYDLQAPSRMDVARGPWQWNTFVIEAIGPRIKVTLNDVLVTEFTDPAPRSLRGHIGLQNHHPGSKVQFRNIRVTPLTGATMARRGARAGEERVKVATPA